MLNFLWIFMILAGIVYAAFTGNLPAVTDAALDAAQQAVTLCITMAGVLAFWVGLMRIAENAGMMQRAADRIYPLLHFLLQAVHQPYRKKFDFTSDRIRHTHVKREKVASTEMCTFLVLNISSLQLIPVTVIAYRSKYGSPDPTGIVGAAIVATAFSTLAGIIFAKIMSAADRKRGY